jgi:hypothetical protein
VKHLNETFTDAEFRELEATKEDRTWRAAILEEFGVDIAEDNAE